MALLLQCISAELYVPPMHVNSSMEKNQVQNLTMALERAVNCHLVVLERALHCHLVIVESAFNFGQMVLEKASNCHRVILKKFSIVAREAIGRASLYQLLLKQEWSESLEYPIKILQHHLIKHQYWWVFDNIVSQPQACPMQAIRVIFVILAFNCL